MQDTTVLVLKTVTFDLLTAKKVILQAFLLSNNLLRRHRCAPTGKSRKLRYRQRRRTAYATCKAAWLLKITRAMQLDKGCVLMQGWVRVRVRIRTHTRTRHQNFHRTRTHTHHQNFHRTHTRTPHQNFHRTRSRTHHHF